MYWMLLLSCARDAKDPGDDDPIAGDDDDDVIEPPEPVLDIHPDDDLSGLADVPCGSGVHCAADGPYLGDSCCTYGDNLVHVANRPFSETVGLAAIDDAVMMCGGFGGGVIHDLSGTELPYAGASIPRCQRVTAGPILDNGNRAVWFAHHGDSWIETPGLYTRQLTPDGDLHPTFAMENVEPDVLYEGMAWHEGYLYVAAHAGGLRVYETDADGRPTFVDVLGGFDNALLVEIVADEDLAYVADQSEVAVVDISNPSKTAKVAVIDTPGKPRDIAVRGDRLYVALGSSGLAAYDRTSGTLLHEVAVDGSSQAVDATDAIVASANWTHVAIYDAETMQPLGRERLRGSFEQDLAVAFAGDRLFVGEWNGVHELEYRQGHVAPDIWGTEDLYAFPSDEPAEVQFDLSNLGPLWLDLQTLQTTDTAVTVSPTSGTIRPGKQQRITLSYTPPEPVGSQQLQITSNDPDALQNPLRVPLQIASTSGLDVGDELTDTFSWLDPTGGDDLDNLRGHVIVLAYFALF